MVVKDYSKDKHSTRWKIKAQAKAKATAAAVGKAKAKAKSKSKPKPKTAFERPLPPEESEERDQIRVAKDADLTDLGLSTADAGMTRAQYVPEELVEGESGLNIDEGIWDKSLKAVPFSLLVDLEPALCVPPDGHEPIWPTPEAAQ